MNFGTNNPYFEKKYALRRLRRGPLSPYLDGFAHRLKECGYSPVTGRNYVRCIGHLSLWLEEKGFAVCQLDQCKIDNHLQTVQHQRGVVISSAPHCLFLSYLRELGVVPQPTPKAVSKIDRIVDEYLNHLRKVRGLAESTLIHRRLFTRRFLVERFDGESVRLSRLKAQDVLHHIQRHLNEYGVLYRSGITFVLRDFYRFLHLAGYLRRDVASGITALPHWQPTSQPVHLAPSDMEHLLTLCDRGTPKGMRDYAILVMLIRLGVRAGEIRNLTLGDIDWQSGQIMVRGKGDKCRQLPLLHDVGEAISSYLKEGRPPSSSRHVFLRTRAPIEALACSGGIYKIVKKALQRAGLKPAKWGPHLLRHSFATHLRGQGTSLPDVGRMLGHDAIHSTQVYAHVSPDELKAVVQAWPGGVS